MEENYLKKIDRVTAILTRLQSKKIVKAQELADRFEVSLRTIYRDLKTLENAGVPILGEAGVGYSLMDGYKLPPMMFTKEEVLSLITAEKLMQKFSDKGIGMHYERAIEKVKALLNSADKLLIQQVEQQINVFNNSAPPKEGIDENCLAIILQSIAQKVQLKINYRCAKDEISVRSIEAIGIFHEFNKWYVLAYCLLRKEIRQFRLDRIVKTYLTDSVISEDYGQVSTYRKAEKIETVFVRLLVDKSMKPYLVNSKYYYGFVEEKDLGDFIDMCFETNCIDEGFPRWLISFGDYVQIIEPESLRLKMNDLLQRITKKMNS